jgi:hypothetical protein
MLDNVEIGMHMAILKRCMLIVVSAGIVFVIAIIVYIFSGSAAIESWVGSQLLSMGGSYLQPELHFDRLTYRRPRTIVVENLTFSSPDPTHPGASIVILAVKRARLELTEIPRPGKPIQISEIILESPQFRAMALTPGASGLVGFSQLLKSSSATATSSAPTDTVQAPPLKLSDFLLIHHIEINHGLILYDPRIPNTQPMQLDDINCRLELAPSSLTTGLYTVGTTITRKPIFELDLQGQFNIDTLAAQLTTLALKLDMRQENAHYLPPEIQAMLRNFEISGQLHIAASGDIPLADFPQCTIHSSAEIQDAGFAIGPYRFSADTFNSTLEIANGIATIQKADSHLLGGEIHVTGTIPLDPAKSARLELSANNIQIEKTLRSADPNGLPRYAGMVAAHATYTASLAMWRSQATGNGTITIRRGRIGNIPGLGGIVTGVSHALSKTIAGDSNTLTDTADAVFTLAGDHIQLDQLTAKSGEMGLRGNGIVGFDQQLNLRLNAGPMEHLQDVMGGIGKFWASASDKMAGYRVTGTLADPHVAFEIGGHTDYKK